MKHLVNGFKHVMKLIQENQELLHDLGTAAQLASQLGTGHPVIKATATISILSKMANRIYPKLHPGRVWARIPLDTLSSSFENLIYEYALQQPHEVIDAVSTDKVTLWSENGKVIMAIRQYDCNVHGIKLNPQHHSFLHKIVSAVWKKGSCLEISKPYGFGKDDEVIFSPLSPPTPYIGGGKIDEYIKRAKAHRKGGRTIMLKGSTGTGKSSIARLIASNISENSRTLKIPGRLLQSWRGSELLELLKLLKPSMLLLDDVDPKRNTETLLDILETIRKEGMVTIMTMMEDGAGETGKPKQGDWHYPGMRPGRIDEIIHIPIPDAVHRAKILKFYAKRLDLKIKKKTFSKIVKATDGLPGAYLAAVIDRIDTHGIKNWKQETELILRTTPPKPSEEEEDD